MYALLTYDNAVAHETILCATCYVFKENRSYAREMASHSDDINPELDFVTESELISIDEKCIICSD